MFSGEAAAPITSYTTIMPVSVGCVLCTVQNIFVDAVAEGTKSICGMSVPAGDRFVQVFDGVHVSIVMILPPEFVFPTSVEATSKFPLDTK